MPAGMAAMFIAMLALAVACALLHKGGCGFREGARIGLLAGVFSVCALVVHNYVNLNIGLRLTAMQAGICFVSWVVTGAFIGLV